MMRLKLIMLLSYQNVPTGWVHPSVNVVQIFWQQSIQSVFCSGSGPCLSIFLWQKKKVLLFIECATESLSHFCHSQMDGVENMDGEFEQTTLNMFIDWNDNTFQPTFFHSDTPHTAFQNFEETITELAAVLTPPVSTKTTFILINLCRICLFPLINFLFQTMYYCHML